MAQAADTWNVITQAISLAASITSLAMSIVAIWLSIKFYHRSEDSSKKLEEINREIKASIVKLETIFNSLYSNVYSMLHEIVRKRFMLDTNSVEETEQLAESKTNERVEQLKADVKSELDSVVERVGQTDAKLSNLRQQLEGVVEKAINRSIEAGREAREENIKDHLIAHLKTLAPSNLDMPVVALVFHFRDIFWPPDILKALVELNQEGVIEFDRAIHHWSEITGDLTFKCLRLP
jgi:uncharacterized phage infection (PIP) family protein YhgE